MFFYLFTTLINQPEPVPVETGLSFGWLLLKTLLALALILGLLLFLFRVIVPKIQGPGFQAGKKIQILERVAVDPRKFLCLVKVGKKTILVGASEQGISHITDLSEDEV